jgi:hypothetical protein
MMGTLVGVSRMILDFIYPEPACGEEDVRPAIIARMHYMYFAMLLFWLTITIVVVVSLLTEPPNPDMVSPLQILDSLFITRFGYGMKYVFSLLHPTNEPPNPDMVRLTCSALTHRATHKIRP